MGWKSVNRMDEIFRSGGYANFELSSSCISASRRILWCELHRDDCLADLQQCGNISVRHFGQCFDGLHNRFQLLREQDRMPDEPNAAAGRCGIEKAIYELLPVFHRHHWRLDERRIGGSDGSCLSTRERPGRQRWARLCVSLASTRSRRYLFITSSFL